MTEVIPAIMPKTWKNLKERVEIVSPYVSNIQLDLMDGKFLEAITWPYFSYKDPDFAALLSEDLGLPEWDKIDYEIDLMSSTPESDAFDWIKAGAKRIILHVESSMEIAKLIKEIRAEYGNPNENASAPEIGIAALNDTPISLLEDIIPLVDFVQLMGIRKIGYQGEPFDERVLERIKILKAKYPELVLSVDGAVNADTAPILIKAGVERLVSGSYIYQSEDIKKSIETLGGK